MIGALALVCGLLLGLRPDFVNSAAPALPLAVLAFVTGAWLSRRSGLVGALALMASIQVAMGFADFPNVEIALIVLIPWWAGTELRARRALVTRLAARQRQLEAAEDSYVRLSVRRERAVIARELHDIVAHHLAVIVVQAGAGRMAANGTPETRAARFRTIASAGEQALTDMARLIDVLQADGTGEGGGFARLPALLAQAAAGGLDVHMTPLPHQVELGASVESAAVAVIHESLTNAIKHAPGAVVEIRLDLTADALVIEVTDDGPAARSTLSATGAGLGLAGMRERVEALGGTLTAGPQAGGWQLRASLPRVRHPSQGGAQVHPAG